MVTSVSDSTSGVSADLMAAVNAKTTTTDSSVDADTNKFLTLLVTQMQNQDPLNPLDNAQVTSQLAQLSTVTGVDKLNTTLNTLMGSYQSSTSVQAANLIGHGVLTAGTALQLTSSASVFGVDLATAADDVTVKISDASGNVVKTMDLGAQPVGTIPLTWDGTVDDAGNGAAGLLADGKYSISVTATAGSTTLTDATALTYGTVASVTTSATDGVKVTIPNVGTVKMSDVKQIL